MLHALEPGLHVIAFCLLTLQAVYISYLLSKEKLVKYFHELQLFKDDIRLPAEVRVTHTAVRQFQIEQLFCGFSDLGLIETTDFLSYSLKFCYRGYVHAQTLTTC